MRRALVLALIGGWLLQVPALADASLDALQWLNRVSDSARKLTYSGVFVYQNGTQTEVSRITHLVDSGNEQERLEVLDGSPREVLRLNDEVRCFLPERHLLIVERRNAGRKAFPALLPASLAGLTEYYTISKGETSRVAGLESQIILIEPKDDLRYGRQFWVDEHSGLLLKAALVNDHGKTLETFAFTELHIGGPVDRAALNAHPDSDHGGWKVINVHTVRGDDNQWSFRTQLPGFRKVMSLRRQLHSATPEMTHILFSDGLAAVSVFVEPLAAGSKPETGSFAMGSINIYKRIVADHLIVVMGDLPPSSLKMLGDGVEPKRK